MHDTISIHSFNNTFLKIHSDNKGILDELSDRFSFDVDGAKYAQSFKDHKWDGKIKLFRRVSGTIYKGLLSHVVKFAIDNNYKYIIDPLLIDELKENTQFDAEAFIKSLNIQNIIPYEFQIKTIEEIIKKKRKLILSPVNSGKSYIIYCVLRWYLQNLDQKILILLPSVDLILQMMEDFKKFCPDFDIESHIHQIYQGQEKDSDKQVYISTWQSLNGQKRKYFLKFGAVVGDEVHELSASVAKHIIECCINAKYKIGLTGTVKDVEMNLLTLEGLTGKLLKVTTTKKMIEQKRSSNLTIKCVMLKHSEFTRKANKSLTYHEEQSFIMNDANRNKIITSLAKNIKNENILILTQYIDHTRILQKLLENSGKKVFVITGETEKDLIIEKKMETELSNDIVIIATYGKFQRGISIKNLQHLIFATGSKSFIRVWQSIGRILRLDGRTDTCTLWDLIDDFSYGGEKNYLLKHFIERIKIYKSEGFDFILKKINL